MKTLTTLFIAFTFTHFVFAQNYSFISKDLHKMEDKELMDNQVQLSEDTLMFDEKGNTIAPGQINDLMSSGNFIPLVYGDKNHKAKALVFRKATAEEKKAMQDAMRNQDPNANFVPGQKAKDFTAYDIDGNIVKLEDFKGKIVVLNFWFPQCQPCVMEMPELNKLAAKYKKDIVFLSVTFEKKALVKEFLSNRTFKYRHIVENEDIINEYQVVGFPTHILIDKKGEIVMRKVGNFVKELDQKIALLIKQ